MARIALVSLVCLGAAACNTVAGFGHDVGATGRAITRAAHDTATGQNQAKAPVRCSGPASRPAAVRCKSGR